MVKIEVKVMLLQTDTRFTAIAFVFQFHDKWIGLYRDIGVKHKRVRVSRLIKRGIKLTVGINSKDYGGVMTDKLRDNIIWEETTWISLTELSKCMSNIDPLSIDLKQKLINESSR